MKSFISIRTQLKTCAQYKTRSQPQSKNNTRIRTMVLTFLLGAGAIVSHPSAHAFTLYRTSAGVVAKGWQVSSLTFDVDSSCTPYADLVSSAVSLAIGLWNNVPSDNISLSIGVTTTLPGVITNYVGTSAIAYAPIGNPLIYCDTNFSTDSGESADSIPGFATGFNLDSGGKIQGALLVLNLEASGAASLNQLDANIASIVLAHEIGHILGLGHSADANALMYYSTGANRKLVLAQDDIDGISYLYSRNELGGAKMMGCNSTSSGRNQDSNGSASARNSRRNHSSATPDTGAAEFFTLIVFCWLGLKLTDPRRFSI